MRCNILALLISAAATILFVTIPAKAQSAQEFNAAEASGAFSTKRQSRISAPRNRTPDTFASTLSATAPIGLSLGGSWLTSNMGAARPRGAPGLWCGYAMRMEMQSQGHGDPGPQFNLVSSWCRIGTPAPVGAIGSIFVSRGHVSKVVAGDCPPGRVATISGNANGRRVSHMCEPISRAICSRWPGGV